MGSGTQMLIMNTKLFALALLATLAASKEIMREKRSPIGVAEGAALAGAVGLGGLGGYSVYDWISRGSEAGARTELGLGPLELVYSHGIGAAPGQAGRLVVEPPPTRVSPPRVSEWYTVGEPTIIRLPSTTTNVRRPYPVDPIPSGPSLIEFSAGADLGPLHEGTRFSIGGGAPVQLQDNQHNLVGVNTGLSVGGLNTAFQTGLGVGK